MNQMKVVSHHIFTLINQAIFYHEVFKGLLEILNQGTLFFSMKTQVEFLL